MHEQDGEEASRGGKAAQYCTQVYLSGSIEWREKKSTDVLSTSWVNCDLNMQTEVLPNNNITLTKIWLVTWISNAPIGETVM